MPLKYTTTEKSFHGKFLGVCILREEGGCCRDTCSGAIREVFSKEAERTLTLMVLVSEGPGDMDGSDFLSWT